jgi:hypothetical protein
MNIPRDKDYPDGAGQCHDCGGHGCATCEGKGWLLKGHPKIRKCHRDECGNPLAPDWVPVYCSGQCAMMDA